MVKSQKIITSIVSELKAFKKDDKVIDSGDFNGVALLATAVKLELKIFPWMRGDNSSLSWSNGIFGFDKFPNNEKLIEKLDSWPIRLRENFVIVLKNEKISLSDLFADLRLSSENGDESKSRGSIFTPSWLAKKMVKDAQAHWKRLHRTGELPKVIADTSCGVGVFLDEYRNIFGSEGRLIGIDKDEETIFYTKLLGIAQGKFWKAYNSDSLKWFPKQPMLGNNAQTILNEGEVELLLGNPPYVRSQLLNRAYAKELSSLYPSMTSGNYDLVILFIDQALKLLASGGIASYILSSKFMSSNYGEEICRRLAKEARVIQFIDFGDAQLFEGKTTYTCVLTFSKMMPIKRFTVTNFPDGIEDGKDPGKGQSFTLSTEKLKEHPWVFIDDKQETALKKIQASTNLFLKDVFSCISQGVRTGANEIFVIPNNSGINIEPELLVPFVTGEDIRRMRCDLTRQKLLYPYNLEEGKKTRLLTEEELEKYSVAKSYLSKNRDKLKRRVLDSKNDWYGYSRSQNLDICKFPKVLFREMMPRAEVALDLDGNVTFSSGYGLIALSMSDEEMILWAAILNTPTMEFAYRNIGTQLRSGWFRLLEHHINRVKLPSLTSDNKIKAIKLAAKLYSDPNLTDIWRQLDDIVASSFSLNSSEREMIYKTLEGFHLRSLSQKTREHSTIHHNTPNEEFANLDKYEPVKLEKYDHLHVAREDLMHLVTFSLNKEMPIHRWYQFTQGFSEPLVKSLLKDLDVLSNEIVLDPFTGVGTTNLVCKKGGIPSLGFDISPFTVFIAKVKTNNWNPHAIEILIDRVRHSEEQILTSHAPHNGILFEGYFQKAFSPQIFNQIICTTSFIKTGNFTLDQRQFLMAGLVGIMEEVSYIRKHGSHYRFMDADENIGLQKLNIQLVSPNTNIFPIFLKRLNNMLEDIRSCNLGEKPNVLCDIHEGDSRSLPLPDKSVNVVITSPPYLNRNNYINQQKAELAISGLLESREEYQKLVNKTIHSHVDGSFGKEMHFELPEINKIVDAISITPNNNPKIPNMVAEYFFDLGQAIKELARVVAPGGRCAFVVGNSRWGGIVVPVDHVIMKVAEKHGFIPERILVTRLKGNSPQQMRLYGKIPVRESVVIFSKP